MGRRGKRRTPQSGQQQTDSTGGPASSTADGAAGDEAPRDDARAAEREHADDFPVVAIGASAGGLDAVSQFLAAVPEQAGMAFVVLQHLAPERESNLPELLGHRTPLATVVAEHGQRLEPDRVYVIPPGKWLAVEGGCLCLSKPPANHRMPIDYFLRSLAAERGTSAIAVILSGTGTDGTLGARAVKSADGVVAVQTPESAAYPGMPSSVLESVRVDFELPASELPAAITGYARRRPPASAEQQETVPARTADALAGILEAVRDRSGHDFSEYKTSTVMRRIDRRMAVVGTDDARAYARLLGEWPEEVDRLFAELLIPVTGFFRDPEAFAALQQRVLPAMLEEHDPAEELRIWVPGCSTGEEAYSIAMLVTESMQALKRRPPLQVFATDIDASALETARRGRYPASIEQDVSAARLQRFFTREGDHYVVSRHLRDVLVFAEQDVTRDPPFSRMNLISCRNLLIYMTTKLQQRVLPMFHYALRPGGYLFLGAAETIGSMDDLFAALDTKWRLFQRREDRAARHLVYALPQFAGRRARGEAGAATGTPVAGMDYEAVVQRLLLRDHVPAAVLVDANDRVLYLHGRTGDYLQPASGHPSNDLRPMLRPGLESVVRRVIQQARRRSGARVDGRADLALAGQVRPVSVAARGLEESEVPQGAVLLVFAPPGPEAGDADDEHTAAAATREENEAEELRRQLSETREDLQATIEELETSNEELQSSNEELQSSNEELQSTNEELETSREELQSVNEELRSVNAEMEAKVDEATRARQDMDALLASTGIGVVCVDAELRIERFTPAVQRILPLREADLGRPIGDLSPRLRYDGLTSDLQAVIEQLESRKERVEGEDGHSYMMRMHPYRSSDARVLGAVLVFVDVTDEIERAFLHKLREALGQSQELVMLVALDGGIEYVNDAFCEATGYREGELVGVVPDALARPNLAEEDRRAMDWALRSGRIWRGGFAFACRDGRILDTQALFAPIRTGAGITHAVAFLHVESEASG